MKFVLLINIKLLTIANSFLQNIAEHETFSANKYENANNEEANWSGSTLFAKVGYIRVQQDKG